MRNRCPETLFRQQAVDALSERPFGRPICATPRPWPWLTVFTVVLALAGAVFLATAEYARKETVRGWLVARGGITRISPDAPGVVERVARAPGDTVVAGEPLVYLSRETFLRDGRSSIDELMLELEKQVSAIDRRAELLRAEAAIESNSVVRQLDGVDAEINTLVRREKEQQHRLHAASDKLLRLRAMASRGAVTDWDVLGQQDELAALSQARDRMQQERIALDRERQALTARSKRLPMELQRAVSRLDAERSTLLQRMTEQKSGQHVVLKSPVAGTLAAVEVQKGGTVAVNQLLATVVPSNRKLAAEVFVPSSAVGFIKSGQRVRLTYDAFPRQQFGTFLGEVEHVSGFVLMPHELPQTFHFREATFKVRISLQTDSLPIEAGTTRLRPGMLLAAEIILEERRLADWLLEPIRLRRRDAV